MLLLFLYVKFLRYSPWFYAQYAESDYLWVNHSGGSPIKYYVFPIPISTKITWRKLIVFVPSQCVGVGSCPLHTGLPKGLGKAVISLAYSTVHLSQNAPVCTQDIFWCVVCEYVSFTDISIIVADFLCGQVSSYDVC